MRLIYTYILFLFTILAASSCSSDEEMFMASTEQEQNLSADNPADNYDSKEKGTYASMPELIDGNAVNDGLSSSATTRSTLIYDKTAKKTLFSWGKNDDDAYMCVFKQNMNINEAPQDMVTPLYFSRIAGQDTTTLNSRFESRDNTVSTLTGNTTYISFRPYSNISKVENSYNCQQLNYTKYAISYEGQENSANVKMKESFATTDNYDTYKASERSAARHIGAYDYLVSAPTTTKDNGSVYFDLKRVGVSARFYLKCPAAEVFEELQLVSHNTALFTLQGTMDLSSMTITDAGRSIDINPTKQSNVIVLSYDYDASDETNHPGLDMTSNTSDYYYNNIGYIVSYMMLPPVDLSTAVPDGSTNSVNLYLVSHTTAAPTVKKYYKSSDLKKPKLTSNMFYQWTSANNSSLDTPISFEEITVQQWQEEALGNGEGTGTEGW